MPTHNTGHPAVTDKNPRLERWRLDNQQGHKSLIGWGLTLVAVVLATVFVSMFDRNPLELTPARQEHIDRIRADIMSDPLSLNGAVIEFDAGRYGIVSHTDYDGKQVVMSVFFPKYNYSQIILSGKDDAHMLDIVGITRNTDEGYATAREMLLPTGTRKSPHTR